ncbi:PEP-CTERM sorting domain-containing protein [bacterium]|nr:PEP-CTERM sorting domain-containing protein [bacterium]
MKKLYIVAVTAFLVFSLAVSASAVPSLQTYITDARYEFWHGNLDQFSWLTNNQQFDLSIVGSWGPTTDMLSGGNAANMLGASSPTYDYLDTYLSISVPKNQSGRIYINGNKIDVFKNYFDAVPVGTHPAWYLPMTAPSIIGDFNFMHNETMITNEGEADWHHCLNSSVTRVRGGELKFDVVIEGFDWVNFDAIGVDSQGRTITNAPYYDSSYFATPEPGTLSLLGLGLLGIVPFIRRKK